MIPSVGCPFQSLGRPADGARLRGNPDRFCIEDPRWHGASTADHSSQAPSARSSPSAKTVRRRARVIPCRAMLVTVRPTAVIPDFVIVRILRLRSTGRELWHWTQIGIRAPSHGPNGRIADTLLSQNARPGVVPTRLPHTPQWAEVVPAVKALAVRSCVTDGCYCAHASAPKNVAYFAAGSLNCCARASSSAREPRLPSRHRAFNLAYDGRSVVSQQLP
jgi:hypothetical protein